MERTKKLNFFHCCCHHNVKTTTCCHDAHFFCCRCHHDWVLNPFMTSTATTQKMPLSSQCERAFMCRNIVCLCTCQGTETLSCPIHPYSFYTSYQVKLFHSSIFNSNFENKRGVRENLIEFETLAAVDRF